MKKVILLTIIIILVPFIIINLFVKDEEIKFKYVSGMAIRVKDTQTNKITNVPFEDYIVGVLAGEMPITFELEALKAQAVAARSYAMKQMSYNKDKEYDVVNTINNQVYLTDEYLKSVWKDDYVSKINKIKTAVLQTSNEYLDYEGDVAEAMFFSTSVGYTENSEDVFKNSVPYLRSVSSTWDEISPVYEVSYKFSLSDFYQKLNIGYNKNIKLEVLSTTSTGRIKNIKINGVIFQGETVRSLLNLKSNYFEITQNGDVVNVVTKGYGHGVGMSQYGAQAMALKGYTYDKILSHYYQGTTIKKF